MIYRIGALLLAMCSGGIAVGCIITWGFTPKLLWVLVAASGASFILYARQFRVARQVPLSRLFGTMFLTMIGGALSSGIVFGGEPHLLFGLYVLLAAFLGAFLALMGSIVGLGVAYGTRPKQESLDTRKAQ